MNPSYSKKDAINSLDCLPNASVQELLQAQELNHKTYLYFKQITKFFDVINIPRERLWFADLFPIRHTNQFEVTDFVERHPELKRKFLKFFIELLMSNDFSMCVVLNAKASDYIRKTFSENLKPKPIFSEPRSFYSFVQNDGTEVPIIFAGMITGAGQMDKYSKERLKSEITDFDKLTK